MEQEARMEAEDAASSKTSFSIAEPESRSELLQKLVTLLSIEKIPGLMTVRKGRVSCFLTKTF